MSNLFQFRAFSNQSFDDIKFFFILAHLFCFLSKIQQIKSYQKIRQSDESSNKVCQFCSLLLFPPPLNETLRTVHASSIYFCMFFAVFAFKTEKKIVDSRFFDIKKKSQNSFVNANNSPKF